MMQPARWARGDQRVMKFAIARLEFAQRPSGVFCEALLDLGQPVKSGDLCAYDWAEGFVALDDPRVFGLVWPMFGAAAALSTLFAGAAWVQANRLSAWAFSHALIALGALLPSFWLAPLGLALSALLIGGTFMVVTMLGYAYNVFEPFAASAVWQESVGSRRRPKGRSRSQTSRRSNGKDAPGADMQAQQGAATIRRAVEACD
jgi:hypothetical protein